ncbi:phospholipid/cholesterol/gamma-HCH transport system substrate-binding protein [Rhodococcus erythropolis]|uniref:MCE family protein n=1 Tax=Rhodococcus erythropolis TaxID=1833 RepID=UPI00216936AB|nr:MCE family protein [Rhodococcus erythropolis]MCS4257867.1 phospholipid/cholesterol/gamma-HCH transport system substrate-binding protein [Rhodococcus erythropolis]MCW2425172.1 phospholipid/cholesterol/gamma-HCH transport system substrate-binding protein [Rhodococcus erythropolis]
MNKAAIKFGVFGIAMLFVLVLLILVLGQLRLDSRTAYHADFADVSGLTAGQVVRISGVDVGRVQEVDLDGRTARVTFDVVDNIRLTPDAMLQVRYQNLLGDRYLEVTNGADIADPMPADATYPSAQTASALDVDALLGGLAPLTRSLDPAQIDRLSGELLQVLQGQGGTVTGILQQVAALTSHLADRDALIGAVITNLGTVLQTVGDDSGALSSIIDQLQGLVTRLSEQSAPISDALVSVNAGSAALADLLLDDRPAISGDIAQLNRTATVLDDGSAQIEAVLTELPQAYRQLSRLGSYGSFFNFYLCAVTLEVDGPGGAPIIAKLVQQQQGRCVTPQ